MHDPAVVVFTIARPWPKRQARPFGKSRWRFRGKFWNIAGRGIYWPSIITVWHIEPDGHDSGTVCKRKSRKRHVHHWRIQVHPLQHLRRWALTRCEWCGGRSRKGDMVNHSKQWDREPGHWWRGERGLFHGDCSSISTAHHVCVCGVGPYPYSLSGYDYGQCASCGLYRGWKSDKERDPAYPGEQSNLLMRSIPDGQRDAAKTEQVRAWWSEWRHREETSA